MKETILGTLLLSLAAILLLLPASAVAQDTIRIGFFAPLTGPAAADGAARVSVHHGGGWGSAIPSMPGWWSSATE